MKTLALPSRADQRVAGLNHGDNKVRIVGRRALPIIGMQRDVASLPVPVRKSDALILAMAKDAFAGLGRFIGVLEASNVSKEKPIPQFAPGPELFPMIKIQVANFFGVGVRDMESARRDQKTVLARSVSFYFMREFTSESFPRIAMEFKGRLAAGKDHTSVMYGVKSVKNSMDVDANFAGKITILRGLIEQTLRPPEAVSHRQRDVASKL